jgi:hypothetical protein
VTGVVRAVRVGQLGADGLGLRAGHRAVAPGHRLHDGRIDGDVERLHHQSPTALEGGGRRDLYLVPQVAVATRHGVQRAPDVGEDSLHGLPGHEVDVDDDRAEVGHVGRLH